MIEAQIIARIPGCENGASPRVRMLGGGRSCNSVLLVETAAGRFVLRRRHDPLDRPGSFARNELLCHDAAALAGLAPALVAAAADGRWLLMEHIEGDPWSADALLSGGGIAALGRRLAAVHALDAPAGVVPIDALAIAEGYLRLIDARDPALRRQLEPQRERVAGCIRTIGAAPRRATLNHGDLQAANLVGPRPMLVDWEYAQVADPTYDIACLLTYYPALVAQLEPLLDSAGLAGAADREILAVQRQLFAALDMLWHQAYST